MLQFRRSRPCAGKLRPAAPGGPRCLPTCLAIAHKAARDLDACTLREADAYLHFLRPHEGWSMGPVPEGLDGWDALAETAGDGPASLAQALIVLVALPPDAASGISRTAERAGRPRAPRRRAEPGATPATWAGKPAATLPSSGR